MTTAKVALLGFGNVGRALADLLADKHGDLLPLELRTVGVLTRRHGAALDPAGLDLQAAKTQVERGEGLSVLSAAAAPEDPIEFIQACGADAVIETTPVNYATGQPALDYLRCTLEHGMHAITANKGPVVHGYRALRSLARAQGKHFLFESAVMDGAPVFSLWRETLPAARLIRFRGILNSTTNLILTLMEDGQSFELAVRRAQGLGIAETDPSGDTQGWDAAVKVAALVTVLMDSPMTPDQVARTGIEVIGSSDIEQALAAGERWKLICAAERGESGLTARVQPERIGRDDPLFAVMGTSSAVTLWTDVLGPLTIEERDPGPRTTAYGLLADLLRALGRTGPA